MKVFYPRRFVLIQGLIADLMGAIIVEYGRNSERVVPE